MFWPPCMRFSICIYLHKLCVRRLITNDDELAANTLALARDGRHLYRVGGIGEHVVHVYRFERRVQRNFAARARLSIEHVNLHGRTAQKQLTQTTL